MKPKKAPGTFGRLSGVGKWITVSVTTVAAIIGLLVNAHALGLTSWLPTLGISVADLAARRVRVVPSTDTLRAIGDTVQLAATVTDARGATLSGVDIVWSTDDSAAAAVDSLGQVVARGSGTAAITASVREHRSSARVTVRQNVRAVKLVNDSVVHLAEGTTLQLAAQALDGRGHAVRGREITWASADIAIVAVSAGGLARAVGPGRTTLTASVEGSSASVTAEVVLTAASVQLIAGAEQRAPAGGRLPQPVQVQVSSRGGRPVPGATVAFATVGSEGGAEPEKSSTDKNGRARSTWTLGAHAGRQRLLVTVEGMDSVLTVMVEADPIPVNTLVQLARPVAGGTVATKMSEAVGIRVTDLSGAAEADVPVLWTTLDGGSIDPQAPRTDSLGQAWAQWTLGPKAGKQRARVQVGNPRTMPPFTITAIATANSAASITVVSGGGQKGRAAAALQHAIVAQLVDRDGNAVAGGTVRVTALEGEVEDSAPLADAKGSVRIRWTLGHKAGVQALELSLGTGAPVHVMARARALAPANVALGSLPPAGTAGRALAKPVTATVTDVYGNGVPDAPVAFMVAAGSVSPARVMTDSTGRASTRWTLGTKSGEQPLTVTVRGTSVNATAVVRAVKSGEK